MKIIAYHGNYRKYAIKETNSNKKAEEFLNRCFNNHCYYQKNSSLYFKIDNSEYLLYNEARIALGFEAISEKYLK